jgi:integrase
MLLLYFATGLRRSEVIQMRGGDLHIEDDEIVIRVRIKGGNYQNRAFGFTKVPRGAVGLPAQQP